MTVIAKKISQTPELTVLSLLDEIPVADASDLTETKHILVSVLVDFMVVQLVVPLTVPMTAALLSPLTAAILPVVEALRLDQFAKPIALVDFLSGSAKVKASVDFLFCDPSDTTKRFYFDISGGATATNGKWIVPSSSGTIADQTLDITQFPLRAINAQTGTAYTLVLADKESLVTLTNVAAITLTVPPNSSVAFPIGTKITLGQRGAGQVTVVGGAGATVNGYAGLSKLAGQYAYGGLVKVATNTWDLLGNLG